MFAISIVVIMGNIRITGFHGFLGIQEISYLFSVFFTIFVFIVIINSLNLIDGIDGLASGVGILTLTSFGIWFLLIGNSALAAFSFSAVGAILAFFRFNVFGKVFKIFLGDTGSLIIGMVISIFTVSFLESSLEHPMGTIGDAAPAIAFGVLIVPMTDTLRVFTLRILWGKSPFQPDRFHVHHRLLDLGYSHLKSTLLILSVNLIIILISVSFSGLGNIRLLGLIFPLAIVAASIPSLMIRYRRRKESAFHEMTGNNKKWMIPDTFSHSVIPRPSFRGRFLKNTAAKSFISRMEPGKLEPVIPDTDSWYRKEEENSLEQIELEEYPD